MLVNKHRSTMANVLYGVVFPIVVFPFWLLGCLLDAMLVVSRLPLRIKSVRRFQLTEPVLRRMQLGVILLFLATLVCVSTEPIAARSGWKHRKKTIISVLHYYGIPESKGSVGSIVQIGGVPVWVSGRQVGSGSSPIWQAHVLFDDLDTAQFDDSSRMLKEGMSATVYVNVDSSKRKYVSIGPLGVVKGSVPPIYVLLYGMGLAFGIIGLSLMFVPYLR